MPALVHAGRDPVTARRSRATIGDRRVVVSFVTVTEMRVSATKAVGARSGGGAWSACPPGSWWCSRTTAHAHVRRAPGGLRDAWARAGDKVHEADRWIAATAIALGGGQVSRGDVFRDVTGLVVRAPSD